MTTVAIGTHWSVGRIGQVCPCAGIHEEQAEIILQQMSNITSPGAPLVLPLAAERGLIVSHATVRCSNRRLFKPDRSHYGSRVSNTSLAPACSAGRWVVRVCLPENPARPANIGALPCRRRQRIWLPGPHRHSGHRDGLSTAYLPLASPLISR